jgi:hypothetical protein
MSRRCKGSTMNVTTYGLDLAKRVFQVHWVEPETGELRRKALARAEVGAFFARRAPGVVAMEACGSAHYWGRVLRGLGHQVRLIAAPDPGLARAVTAIATGCGAGDRKGSRLGVLGRQLPQLAVHVRDVASLIPRAWGARAPGGSLR